MSGPLGKGVAAHPRCIPRAEYTKLGTFARRAGPYPSIPVNTDIRLKSVERDSGTPQHRNLSLGFSLIFPYADPIGLVGECMSDEILTMREVAELLKINEKTAYKLAAAGRLPGFKVGGSWRFERREIRNWIKRSIEEQKGIKKGA